MGRKDDEERQRKRISKECRPLESYFTSKPKVPKVENLDNVDQTSKPSTSGQACELEKEKRAENIEKNRRILKSVVRAIVHCGKQCIPLRGDSENFECKGNPGNFLAILKLVSEYDKDLDQHLTSPAMRNAKMTSHRIQNEVLEIVAQHYIVANLCVK